MLRRVDDDWCDPLELRPDSELGVPGLLEACAARIARHRQRLGAGLVESPAVARLPPRAVRGAAGRAAALPSAAAWWCGDPLGLATSSDHLDGWCCAPVDPARGRGVYGPGLTAAQREPGGPGSQAETGAWVGQQVLPLSTTPTVGRLRLDARPLTLRAFAVARQGSYAVMPGALGRIVPGSVDPASGRRDGSC